MRDSEGWGKAQRGARWRGDVSWPDVMKALDDIGYNGYGIAEGRAATPLG